MRHSTLQSNALWEEIILLIGAEDFETAASTKTFLSFLKTFLNFLLSDTIDAFLCSRPSHFSPGCQLLCHSYSSPEAIGDPHNMFLYLTI